MCSFVCIIAFLLNIVPLGVLVAGVNFIVPYIRRIPQPSEEGGTSELYMPYLEATVTAGVLCTSFTLFTNVTDAFISLVWIIVFIVSSLLAPK